MATFLEAQTRILRAINRPAAETAVLAGVKDAINDAILVLQRERAYNMTEMLTSYAYLVNVVSVSAASALASPIRDVLSVQQVSPSGVTQGKPLMIKSYSQLQQDRMNYYRAHSTYDDFITSIIEDGYRDDLIFFLAGPNFGLYPTPQAGTTNLLLSYHAWLPVLVADGDTNFLLVYAYDVVVAYALRALMPFMKMDMRYQISDAELKDRLAGLYTWDASIVETPNTTIG